MSVQLFVLQNLKTNIHQGPSNLILASRLGMSKMWSDPRSQGYNADEPQTPSVNGM